LVRLDDRLLILLDIDKILGQEEVIKQPFFCKIDFLFRAG